MIRVKRQPEPKDFDEDVRRPGKEFLAKRPNPTNAQFKNHAHWGKASRQLYESYGKVCSFCCLWIPSATGVHTVEHFRPKVKYPNLAYEWKNYRLVSLKLNGRKGEFEDVIDPFQVHDGWFILDFPSLLVRPNPQASKRVRKRIQATINRLRLNDDETCVEERSEWLRLYCDLVKSQSEVAGFAFLEKMAPFLASELERQKLRTQIASNF